MSSATHRVPQPTVLAALVLYGRSAEESPAYTALHSFQTRQADGAQIGLLLFDNSSHGYPAPADMHGRYISFPHNPGLAEPYNLALVEAEARGIRWLLLLDQDTKVTEDYLQEVLASVSTPVPACAVAFVPRLLAGPNLLSPHIQPYWPRQRPLTTDVHGTPSRRLHYFNSGAVLSVEALRAIGGFPADFWLDYLDHAVFFQLQARGGQVRILRSGLQHDLASETHTSPQSPARQQRERNSRAAALRYYQRYESGGKLLQHRLALLWGAACSLLAGKRALARELANLALSRKA